MDKTVLDYVEDLKKTKGISVNTEMAYRRDLMKLVRYLADQEGRTYKYDDFQKHCVDKRFFCLSDQTGTGERRYIRMPYGSQN